MIRLWYGFCAAFSLYSHLPVPRAEWKRENLRFALCFFPLVGAVIGGAEWLWYLAAARLELTSLLYGAVAALLPVLISGGIHMDGWVDTVDGLSAHTGPEKRLEILADPHVGAFGVIGCACYLLLQLGLWCQLYETPRLLAPALAGFVLSRAGNALSIALLPSAKATGLAYTLREAASPKAVGAACGLYFLGFAMLCARVSPLCAAAMAGGIVLYFILHRRFCIRRFGGNTGDLAGFFLQNVELGCLGIAVLGSAL